MARSRIHHDDKKNELTKISFDLFMKNGYENTSIQDIMVAAKISKGAMYHYFTCKEDILDAVLNYIIDLDVARFETVFNNASLSSLEKLTATMSFEVAQVSEEIQQATEYIMKRPDSIFDYRARELSKKRNISYLVNLIREGVEKGEFDTKYPEEMAYFIYGAAQSTSELIQRQISGDALSNAFIAFTQLLTHCLGLKKKDHDFLADFFTTKLNIKQCQNK